MVLLQVIAVGFSAFAFSRVILRAKDNKLSFLEAVFWNLVWLSLVVVAFFPNITTYFAKIVGIGRGVDLIIYISIGLLFYLLFRLYIKLEDMEQEMTKVVRHISYLKKK